jgi:hypothetical protein
VMNREDLGHKGRLQAFSKHGFVYKRKGDIYRLIFRVSTLPGQLSELDRTRCDRSHLCMNFCI